MSKQLAPFHFDIVGSFLRPEELKEAREAFNNGNISREELTAVEDRLITDLIQKQKAAGLPVITDGEFRRAYWHLDFMWGFNGVKEIELEHGYKFIGQETAPGSLALTGKITGTNHPFVEHFKFVKQFEDSFKTLPLRIVKLSKICMMLVAATSSLMIVLGVCAVTTLTGQVVKRIKA